MKTYSVAEASSTELVSGKTMEKLGSITAPYTVDDLFKYLLRNKMLLLAF